MIGLLTHLHNKAEELKGKRLLITIALSFVAFLITGLLVGYFISKTLSNNEAINIDDSSDLPLKKQEKTYEGKIKFIDPQVYAADKVSYILVDSSGNPVILLRSKDQKLAVAENLYVKIIGFVSRSADNKMDVLDVERINVSNGAN